MLSQSKISLEKRVDLSESQKKMWRTLIRVGILKKDQIEFIIPGKSFNKKLYFNLRELPEDLRKRTHPGYRFHCQVNYGAEKKEDLYINIDSYELD